MKIDPHVGVCSVDIRSLLVLLHKMVCDCILYAEPGVLGVLYVAVGHMAEDCEGVLGSEKISPCDSFCLSVKVICIVATKTGKRSQHPADQAGGVIDEIE